MNANGGEAMKNAVRCAHLLDDGCASNAFYAAGLRERA
jgi:hypothetical protein